MEVGMLWFDNDPRRDLKEKVLRAAAHYERKYGHKPNVCFVHPSMLQGNGSEGTVKADGVEVRSGRAVLPDHFWIGTADD
ncbi:MAG TPA: hypothetical protein EYH27_01020 [Anaerolineales bacterium]|nr:hypothetical protein [Anaerolineales bacterium]